MTWGDIVMTDPVQLIGTAAAAVAAVLILVAAGRRVAAFVQRVVHFLDDWQGEKERPGIPGRPGVMERLSVVETRSAQLTPNGGSHLADAVDRIEAQLAEHIAACTPAAPPEGTP